MDLARFRGYIMSKVGTTMDNFKIAQLTKELVASRIKGAKDPEVVAADLVKETLGVALKAPPSSGDPSREAVIEEACRGGITALVLAEADLREGAVLTIAAVAELSTELDLDPTAAMQGALKGIADLQRFVPAEQLIEVGKAIESRFMGAGAAYLELVQAGLVQAAKSPAPGVP